MYYSNEKNIQILISLLKQNGIRRVIASAGTTHLTFLGSLQNDPYFEIYSCVDERSAAYMAVGMTAENNEPVVITCTGSTASRNYYPGLTEAYYRKLPILAVTAHQGKDRIGQLIPQNIDRSVIANDAVVLSVELEVPKSDREYHDCVTKANRAILTLLQKEGPVHINLYTFYSADFTIKNIPEVRKIEKYQAWDELPVIKDKKYIGIYVGSHNKFTEKEHKAIDDFCSQYNAVVFCDLTSGYYGKYKVQPSLLNMQKYSKSVLPMLDLMLHIGEVSSPAWNIPAKEIWRINKDGEIRDPFNKLTKVFEMPEWFFFNKLTEKDNKETRHSFLDYCLEKSRYIYSELPELPFSNVWLAQQISPKLPKGSLVHISASNSRRAWNLFPFPEGVESMCNVGVCGIDGCTSTLIGASLADPNRLCFLVTGDLAFFYDLNVLGNRHINNNVRILLVNNGTGVELRLSHNICSKFGTNESYFCGKEHFGNKHPELVKNLAENLGFEYMTASNKTEVLDRITAFINPELHEKPLIFEIFTDTAEEQDSIDIVTTIRSEIGKSTLDNMKRLIPRKGITAIKSLIGKE